MGPETIAAIGMIISAILGPVSAVLITLVWERNRRIRDQKLTVLHTLLATRGRFADPGFSWSIRTVPIYFSKDEEVLKSHSDYLNSVRLEPSPENIERQNIETGRRLAILLSEILKVLGYGALSPDQIEDYTARGLVEKEMLFEQALRALPHIAISSKRSADIMESMVSNSKETEKNFEHLSNEKGQGDVS